MTRTAVVPGPCRRLRWTALAVALILCSAVSWMAPEAKAQKLPPAVAAVIDYQRVLREAAAARSIRSQIEAKRKVYQSEISAEEKRLHEADKAFSKQRSLLSPEAFAEKRQAFEKDVAEVQRLAQERRRELDQLLAKALNEVTKALIEVVRSIADERGFNLVLPRAQVLFFAPTIDLTEEVLGKLDASLPDVDLPDPAE